MGTSSPMTYWKDNCVVDPSDAIAIPTMSIGTLTAVAAMTVPTMARKLPPMKNQRRPKISESRPTRHKLQARTRLYTYPTQSMSGDGPMSWFILASNGAARP